MKDLLSHFARPEFFWIMLLMLPLTALFFFWSWRVKQKLIAQFVTFRLLSTLTVGVSAARQKLRLVLLGASVAAILFAVAGPRWGSSWVEAKQRGLDIIVAVDTSRSMMAKDVVPDRLDKAKLAAFDLMRQAKDDRLGLIAFAGAAFLQCPLTLDDEAFRQGVDALTVGIIPQGGTAFSEVIRTTLKAFEKGNDNHKVLILFTDGEDHDEDVETMGAAKEADEAGLRIFTVGVGTAAGELLQNADGSFLKDEDGNAVKSHLNEDLLRKIATTTGGFYLPLRGANPMAVLYDQGLAPLPKSESTSKLTKVVPEHYHWFLGFAVLCLIAEMLIPDAVRQPKAKAVPVPTAPGLAKAAAVVVCLLLLPLVARASGPDAYKKYESGDYKGAFDEYSRLAEQKTNDYRLQYDAGTAAYRAKDLDAAQKQLDAALNSPAIASDLQTQEHAYYNLGNTLYHLGEADTDPKKKQERWEQSIADYSRALRLNTNNADKDAKNNLAFVQRKLEELKQQQQQQQQQQKDQNKDNDKQDQKNQDQKNQDKKDQKDQKDQKSQDQKDQKDKQNQQNQKNQQDQKSGQKDQGDKDKKDQQKQGDKPDDKQQKSGQPKPGQDDQRGKEPPQNQQAGSAMAVPMTMQEAKQMLESQKDDEKTLILTPENTPVKTADGKIKDW